MNRRGFFKAIAALMLVGRVQLKRRTFTASDINRATYRYWQARQGHVHDHNQFLAEMRRLSARCKRGD